MREAVDSPVLSHLFSKGRHRNASTILLLQNMFPKGKYNTDIARNAQCTVLFRSSSDRKQIDIRAEQIFAKDRSKFMEVYHQVTAKPFGYVMVDSHPQAPFERQVVADIFGDCHCYPPIIQTLSSTTSPSRKRLYVEEPQETRRAKKAWQPQETRKAQKAWQPQETWKPFEETYTSEENSESEIAEGEPSENSEGEYESEHSDGEYEEEPHIVFKRCSGKPGVFHSN